MTRTAIIAAMPAELKPLVRGWQHQRSQGVDIVVSLLAPSEIIDLEVGAEEALCNAVGIEFRSFPIADRQTPKSESKLAEVLELATRDLSDGRNVLVHCRQGIGRSGLVAACLLVKKGMSPGAAVDLVSAARGVSVPETPDQRDWIDHHATLTK